MLLDTRCSIVHAKSFFILHLYKCNMESLGTGQYYKMYLEKKLCLEVNLINLPLEVNGIYYTNKLNIYKIFCAVYSLYIKKLSIHAVKLRPIVPIDSQ